MSILASIQNTRIAEALGEAPATSQDQGARTARHATRRFHGRRATSLALNESSHSVYNRALGGLKHALFSNAPVAVVEEKRGQLINVLNLFTQNTGHIIVVKAMTPTLPTETQKRIKEVGFRGPLVNTLVGSHAKALLAAVTDRVWASEAFRTTQTPAI